MSLGSRSVYRKRVVKFARQPKPRLEFRYLATAEERFRELTGAGFTAAVRTASGEAVVKRTFDPNAEETLFFPRLVGG